MEKREKEPFLFLVHYAAMLSRVLLKYIEKALTEDIKDAHLTANTRGAELVRKYVSTLIVERHIPLFSLMKRRNSKTFSSLYKSVVNTTGNVKKW